MSKYTRKQRQAPQDEFVGFWERLFQQVQPYARAIAIVAVTAAVLVAAIWGLSGWREHKGQAATESLSQAVRIYEADLTTAGEAAPKTDEENPVPRFPTAQARAEAALKALDDFDAKYKSSALAGEAQLVRAGIYYDLGRFDDAAALYEKVVAEAKPSPLLTTAQEGLALCREQQGKLDEALALYQKLEPKTGDYFRDRALWNQARIWQKKGDKAKALERLKELVAKVPNSTLKDDAQNQIAQLEGT